MTKITRIRLFQLIIESSEQTKLPKTSWKVKTNPRIDRLRSLIIGPNMKNDRYIRPIYSCMCPFLGFPNEREECKQKTKK